MADESASSTIRSGMAGAALVRWTEHRRLHELGYRILTLPERPGL
ncbi:hypothetical protein [Rhodococcus sp. NPDC047139]